MKLNLQLWFLGGVLMMACPVRAQDKAPDPVPAPAAEPAPIHPGDQFLADVDAYLKVIADVRELEKKMKATKEFKQLQDATDRAAGMQLRISQQVPRGYTFDQKSRLLVPAPRPAPVPHDGTVPAPPAANPAPVKP